MHTHIFTFRDVHMNIQIHKSAGATTILQQKYIYIYIYTKFA